MKLNEINEPDSIDRLIWIYVVKHFKRIGAQFHSAIGDSHVDVLVDDHRKHGLEIAVLLADKFGGEITKKHQRQRDDYYEISIIGTPIVEVRTSGVYDSVRVMPRSIEDPKIERRIMRSLKQRQIT